MSGFRGSGLGRGDRAWISFRGRQGLRRKHPLVYLEQRLLWIVADTALDDVTALIENIEHPETVSERVPVERCTETASYLLCLGALIRLDGLDIDLWRCRNGSRRGSPDSNRR